MLILSLIALVAGLYLLLLALLFWKQERLLFHPERLASEHAFSFPAPYFDRTFSHGGDRIHALYFPGERGLFLYFHGNAGSLANWGHVAAEIRERTGWGVWMLDYPGYGKSTGYIRGEAQMHSLALAALAEARKDLRAGQRLALYGCSIGTGPASRLAAEAGCDALVLESPFFSVRSVVAHHAPWLPGFLLRYPFRSDEAVAGLPCPLLVVHGDQDSLIPASEGERLAALAPRAHFVKVRGAGHSDLNAHSEYWEALRNFLER